MLRKESARSWESVKRVGLANSLLGMTQRGEFALCGRYHAQKPHAGERFCRERDVPVRRDLLQLPRCTRHRELRGPTKTANAICLDCHAPGGLNGPRIATFEEHTDHKKTSSGSDGAACHMPAIQMTIADVNVHAHTFHFISPAMTDECKIPKPCKCDLCDNDRSTT
jgi:hypothetical protein